MQGEERGLEVDAVLLAVGFTPNSGGLGLESRGVALDARGHVITDPQTRTNVEGLYAIGNVAGGPYFAHKAHREGDVVARVLAGEAAERDWRALPVVVYGSPELAAVGLTEAEARRTGLPVRVGRFPFAASGLALAQDQTDGFVKVVVGAEDDAVLGVTIVGEGASELIAEAALALEMVASGQDVAWSLHPHSTRSEALMEAFEQAMGTSIHVPPRRGRARSSGEPAPGHTFS